MPSGAVRLARGVHVPISHADDLATRCRFVLEVCDDQTVISNVTAAMLHGFWLPAAFSEIHVATATPDRPATAMTRTRLGGPVRSHRRRLGEEERAVCQGLPLTSAAQTWVDLGTTLSLPDLVAAGDSALRDGVTRAELHAAIERSRRRRGVRVASAALPLLDERSRSRPETHLRLAASDVRLPRLAVNEPVYRTEGGWLAEPDLSLSEAKLALEYQGERHADVQRMRRDITRSADLRSDGWVELHYGPAQVFGRPWQIAPELVRLVSERAPQLIRGRPARRVGTSAASGQQ